MGPQETAGERLGRQSVLQMLASEAREQQGEKYHEPPKREKNR